MNFHNVVGTGSYTTSTTNMYNKYRFHVPTPNLGSRPSPVPSVPFAVAIPPCPIPVGWRSPTSAAAKPRSLLWSRPVQSLLENATRTFPPAATRFPKPRKRLNFISP